MTVAEPISMDQNVLPDSQSLKKRRKTLEDPKSIKQDETQELTFEEKLSQLVAQDDHRKHYYIS